MEKVELIIKKLQQQFDDNAQVDVMLALTQMLIVELNGLKSNSEKNVSVIMPRQPEIVSEVFVKEAVTPIFDNKGIVEATIIPTIEKVVILQEPISTLEERKGIIEESSVPVIEEELIHQKTVTSNFVSNESEKESLIEAIDEETDIQKAVIETSVFDSSKEQVEENFILELKEEEEDTFIDFKSFIVPELQLDIVTDDTIDFEMPIEEIAELPKEEPLIIQKDRFSFFDEPLRDDEKIAIEDTIQEAPKQEYILDIPDELAIQMGVQPKPPMSITPNDFIFEQYTQIPTLELNEQKVSQRTTHIEHQEEDEINNKFKEHKVEVAHLLENTHIKDLKKAISINERYLFINDLFKGDEHLFERSIKHIQNFSILPEATFWVERELKIPLQWSSKDEVVQLFDQLVKRRFS